MSDRFDMTDFRARYQREQEERTARHKQAFITACTENGIYKVNACFSGCGDSGNIDTLIAYDNNKVEKVLSRAVIDVLEDYLIVALPGGWEINDGSQGDLWAYADGRVGGDIGWNVITVENESIGEGDDPNLEPEEQEAPVASKSKKSKPRGGVL
jgi:hypothetical protein